MEMNTIRMRINNKIILLENDVVYVMHKGNTQYAIVANECDARRLFDETCHKELSYMLKLK